MKLARVQLGIGCLLSASIALSTVHPWGDPRTGARPDAPLLEGSSAPAAVDAILERKCGDCHSERTHYPLYAHLAPVSWMMERDIRQGRGVMDLSAWQSINDESRISVLTRMASVVRSGQMPPRKYGMLHPGARLSPDEEESIYQWAKAEREQIRRELDRRNADSSTAPAGERP